MGTHHAEEKIYVTTSSIEKPSSVSFCEYAVGSKRSRARIPSSRRNIAAMADYILSGMLASAVVKVARDKLVTALRLGDASRTWRS